MEVITALVQSFPRGRPTAAELLRHPFYVPERSARNRESDAISGFDENEEDEAEAEDWEP
jgi:hypothetical protein